jgi:hypothetical protein
LGGKLVSVETREADPARQAFSASATPPTNLLQASP